MHLPRHVRNDFVIAARQLHVPGFAGSLRQGSFNRALLGAAVEHSPEGMTIETFDLAPIPLYNFDVEERGDPEAVESFKEAIADADGCLISTPEYQRGIPGVLKNALDWASRPPGRSALHKKPVAIMGASTGITGTARAQTLLRQTLIYNDCRMLQRPEVLVAEAKDKFDDSGQVTDETTLKFIGEMLDAFADLLRDSKD